jgi:hypothetical protein
MLAERPASLIEPGYDLPAEARGRPEKQTILSCWFSLWFLYAGFRDDSTSCRVRAGSGA